MTYNGRLASALSFFSNNISKITELSVYFHSPKLCCSFSLWYKTHLWIPFLLNKHGKGGGVNQSIDWKSGKGKIDILICFLYTCPKAEELV